MKKILYSLLLVIVLLAHLPSSSGESRWQKRQWKNRMERFVANKDFNALKEEQKSIADSLEKVEQEEPGSPEHNQLQEKQDLLGAYIKKAVYQEQAGLFGSIGKWFRQLIE